MRQSILLGRRHGEPRLSVLAGPADSREMNARFKTGLDGSHDFAEIELWDSDEGRLKRKLFSSPAPAAEPTDSPSKKK